MSTDPGVAKHKPLPKPAAPVFQPEDILSPREIDEAAASVAPAPQVVPGQTIDVDKELSAEQPQVAAAGGEPELTRCPACGTDLAKYQERVPAQEEKENWLRHVLGEERFRKKYTRLGGRLTITLRSRTVPENDQIFAQLSRESADGRLDAGRYVLRMNRLMLTFSLERMIIDLTGAPPDIRAYPEVSDAAYPTPIDGDPGPVDYPVARAYDKILGNVGEGRLDALLDCLQDFEHLQTVLMRNSRKPDFWGPTGSCT